MLRQLARNVPGCVTDLEAGGQPLGLPWRGRLAGRPHGARARVVPDQDDPPPRGTGRPTPTAASRPRRLSWRCPTRRAPCARARRRTLPDQPPLGRRRRSVHRSAKTASRSRFGTFVYTVATRVAMRALRREPRRVARAPRPPWRAGGTPSVVASPLVGKTGSARVAPPLGWRLHRGINPHKSPKSHFFCNLLV